jgi:polar amino acid transport system permease protein
MFKDTPFLAAISVAEMMQASTKIGSEYFRYLESVTICGAIFLVLSLFSARVLRVAERRVGRSWR